MEKLYNVFVRSWWKRNAKWPNGLEPHAGRKTYLRTGLTETQARDFCQTYNATHDPGRASRKAEFEAR